LYLCSYNLDGSVTGTVGRNLEIFKTRYKLIQNLKLQRSKKLNKSQETWRVVLLRNDVYKRERLL
jgi:hypothetical protein